MTAQLGKRILDLLSDNRKSKNGSADEKRPRRPKWVGLLAVVVGLVMWVVMAHAQQSHKLARVGVLAGGGSVFDAGVEPFRQRLRELGYVEDETISLLVRNAEGQTERYRELAAELVQLRVDVDRKSVV